MRVIAFVFVALISAASASAVHAQTGAPPSGQPSSAAPGVAAPTTPPPRRVNIYKEHAKGQEALNKRDYKTAIRIFTEVLESNKLADNWIAPTYFLRAKAHRLSRAPDKALIDYDAALKKDPKLDIAWYEQALVYRNRDNFAKAIDSYSKAIEVKSDNHLYWYGRCEARLFINKLKEAEADCKKALEIKSDYVPALSSLGRVYEDSKQKAKAIETYKAVLAMDPNNKDAKEGIAFLSEKK